MTYQAKDFTHLIGLAGFSEAALTTHFKLYEGYVTNTNKVLDQLTQLKNDTPQYAELKRRLGWEFNGMRLHEYHFDGLTQNFQPLDPNSPLGQKIVQDFGSIEDWEKDFKATAAMRGIGWAILYYDRVADQLINVWVNEHDAGHLANTTLLLNLDVFEHAFVIDYGTKRAEYISAFMQAIDWQKINDRFETAN